MQSAFGSAFEKAFNQAYGYDDDLSPYAFLDENLDATTDLWVTRLKRNSKHENKIRKR